LARQPDEGRDFAQVIVHQRHVGRLDGRVGARGRHGKADLGTGKGWCVVDTVANHAHPMALGIQGLDGLQLVGRQQVAFGTIDADLGGDGLSGMGIVAGEHDRLDTQFMQLGNRLAAALLERVGHSEQSQRATAVEQQDHGLALTLQRIQLRLQLRRAQAQFLDQAVIAQVVKLTFDHPTHTATGQCGEVVDRAHSQTLRLAELGDGT